jgi:hypothetical protein
MMEPDDPITLKEACEIVFRGRITPATLRAEASRGRLVISRIGKRDFTTLREARGLFDKCQEDRSGHVSTGTARARPGSSETVQRSFAQARAKMAVETLKNLSRATSLPNIFPSRQGRR